MAVYKNAEVTDSDQLPPSFAVFLHIEDVPLWAGTLTRKTSLGGMAEIRPNASDAFYLSTEFRFDLDGFGKVCLRSDEE